MEKKSVQISMGTSLSSFIGEEHHSIIVQEVPECSMASFIHDHHTHLCSSTGGTWWGSLMTTPV